MATVRAGGKLGDQAGRRRVVGGADDDFVRPLRNAAVTSYSCTVSQAIAADRRAVDGHLIGVVAGDAEPGLWPGTCRGRTFRNQRSAAICSSGIPNPERRRREDLASLGRSSCPVVETTKYVRPGWLYCNTSGFAPAFSFSTVAGHDLAIEPDLGRLQCAGERVGGHVARGNDGGREVGVSAIGFVADDVRQCPVSCGLADGKELVMHFFLQAVVALVAGSFSMPQRQENSYGFRRPSSGGIVADWMNCGPNEQVTFRHGPLALSPSQYQSCRTSAPICVGVGGQWKSPKRLSLVGCSSNSQSPSTVDRRSAGSAA